jgi:hypothetical protein
MAETLMHIFCFCWLASLCIAGKPSLKFLSDLSLINASTLGVQGNKYGFEGGTVVKDNAGVYHLFLSEVTSIFAICQSLFALIVISYLQMVGDPRWVKMRLAHWSVTPTTIPHVSWTPGEQHVTRVSTLFESSGNYDGTGAIISVCYQFQFTLDSIASSPRIIFSFPSSHAHTDPRAALWAPMPSLDPRTQLWHLFYVAYRCAPDNSTGWRTNFDGTIWHALSTTPGAGGIGGPYRDTGIVLQPDAASQPWEGFQGTDSISPPFVLPNGTWAAFYGSCHSEASPPSGYLPGRWNVGLATTSSLGSPFVRMPFGTVNPSPLNGGYAENPVVTYVASQKMYIAVFDFLNREADGFGLAWSTDGVAWAAELVPVPGGARTPLAAVLEDGGMVSVFFTRIVGSFEEVHVATMQLSFT